MRLGTKRTPKIPPRRFVQLANCTNKLKNLTENFGILPYVKSLDKIKIL